MKKHIIAAAVAAAVTAPAMAQNVTMSGLIDVAPQVQFKNAVGAESIKGSGSTGVSGWSTSNIAFTASEDLGGGMRVSATISSFFDNTNGSPGNGLADAAVTNYNTIGGRDRFIRIDSGMGSLQFGRFTPTINGYCGFACAGGTNNNAGTTDSGSSDLVAGTLSGRKSLSAVAARTLRNNNAFVDGDGVTTPASINATHMEHQSGVIEYTTPTMNGFNAVLTLIQGKNDESTLAGTDKASQNGVRLNYSAGPLSVAYANAVRKSEIEVLAAAAQTKSRIDWLGLSYNLGVAQLFFSHATREDKFTDLNPAAGEITAGDIKVNTIGIAVPMGAVTLNASMYDGDNSGGVGGADDRGLKGHQVSARYALSKRTFVYAVTGTNKDSRKDTTQDNDDFKRTQTQFGVVHSF